jgi:hypothetical protein
VKDNGARRIAPTDARRLAGPGLGDSAIRISVARSVSRP